MRRSTLTVVVILTALLLPGLAAVVIYRLTSNSSARARGPAPAAYRGSVPPAGIQMPAFSLRDYRGGTVSSRSLRGRVVLVTFLDTKCKSKCPIIAGELGSAVRLLTPPERRQISPLALTVNPRTDTPASVRAFLRRHQALGLDFLIGTTKQLRPIWHAFGVVAAAETGNADVHSSDVRVFDRHSVWVSTLHVGEDLTPENLVHDAREALKSS